MKKRGNCYVTCETIYHLMGGAAAGWVPHTVRHRGDVHWFLRRRSWWDEASPPLIKKGWNYFEIFDPTAQQFPVDDPPDYSKSRGRGFLTKGPSRRARELMDRMLWQEQAAPAGRSNPRSTK